MLKRNASAGAGALCAGLLLPPEAGFEVCGFGFGAGFGFGFGVLGFGLIFSGFGLFAEGLFGLLGLLGDDLDGVGFEGDDFEGLDFPDSGFDGLDLAGALGLAGPDLAGVPGLAGFVGLPPGALGFAGAFGLAASPGLEGAFGLAGAPGLAGSALGAVAGCLPLTHKAPSVAAIAQKSRVSALMTSLSAIVLSKLKLQPGNSAPSVSTTCLLGSSGTFSTLRVF